jgi:hypothetical protein
MSVHSSSLNNAHQLQYDDDFFELPNIAKQREKLDQIIDDSLRGIIESFHHITSSSLKKLIRLKCKQHMDHRIKLMIKQMAKHPFSDLLGLQNPHSYTRRQFIHELVLREMDAYIVIAQRELEQADKRPKRDEVSIMEPINPREDDLLREDLTPMDLGDAVGVVPIGEEEREGQVLDLAFGSLPESQEPVLRAELEDLRTKNRGLLAVLNAEKEKNESLLGRYRTEMQQQGMTEEQIETLLKDQSKFKFSNLEKVEISPEIQELVKIKKGKWPIPGTITGRLEKKIHGVKIYRNQLERTIHEVKSQNFEARRELLKRRQARRNAVFQNGMTYVKWRKEYIPYSDSGSEESESE